MTSLKKVANYENFFIDHRCSLKEAIHQMHQNTDGSVVLLKNDFAVAILTESDIVNTLGEKTDLEKKAYDFATSSVITANENRPIEFAFSFISEHNIRRVVLVNNEQKFTGIVLQEDLFDYLEEDVYKADLKIADIIKSSQNIITIKENDSLAAAINLMQSYHVGSILIMGKEKFTGILTEKDILNLIYREVDTQEQIRHYMSKPVVSASK